MSDIDANGVQAFGREAGTEPSSDARATFTSIASALAAASAAGISTIELARGTLSARKPGPDRVELGAWLGTLIGTDPLWSRLGAERRPAMPMLAPVALVHLRDCVLPDANIIVPVTLGSDPPAAAALRNSLTEPCLERLSVLGDVESGAVLEMTIRPGLSVWLQLGATLYFAKFRAGGLPRLSEVRMAPTGGLEFRAASSSAAESMAQRLAHLWPCDFDAAFVDCDGGVRLVDLGIVERSEQENSRHLAQVLGGPDVPSNRLGVLIANAASRVPSEYRPPRAPIYRGQSQGDRCASGPLAVTLAEVARFAADGRRPILVIESLPPAAASDLERCGGLVLGRDGPASHIAILARSLGLAVVTRVDGLPKSGNASTSLGPAVMKSGDLISVREEDGGIYEGVLSPSVSPVNAIAASLDHVGDNPVVLAIGANHANLPTRRIGLCRSEMQVLGSSAAPVFQDFLARAAVSRQPEPVPEEVQNRLRDCLAELLAASRGELTNYRLIDADLGEVLDIRTGGRAEKVAGIGLPPSTHATIRGPRWALASGFYDWQLGMAIATAVAATHEGPVNLVITLPSAFGLDEVRAVRAIFDRHLLEHPDARSSVRFGVMLETPRLCAAPSSLALSAEAFCFGLNDLTSAAFGLAREAWPALGPYYAAAGLEAADPFASLDLLGVGALVGRTIRELRDAGAEGPMLLCGEPAASEAAHRRFASERNLYFSVGHTDWARATMSCARIRARLNGSVGFERSPAYELTATALQQVIAARAIGRDTLAQEVALHWFSLVCPLQPIPDSRNWKVLKKLLVAYLFGATEGRYFPAPWLPEEVARYVRSLNFPARPTRISVFPNDISCHARSEIVGGDWSEPELVAFLESLDPDTTLNVFPQQHIDQMCFRVVFSEAGLALEAGWGQAMYVFEAERGRHPIVSCQAVSADGLEGFESGAPEQLLLAFRRFLAGQRSRLQAMHDALLDIIGADQLAIEGYFDPSTGALVIVDIDLPLDLAWNNTTK